MRSVARHGAVTGGRYLVVDDPFAAWDANRIKSGINPAGDVEVSNGRAVRLVFSAESIASLTN